MTAILGTFLTSWEVEQAVIAHLAEWMPDYLPHRKRRAATLLDEAIPDFPLPRSYEVTPREPDRWKEDDLPAILVVSPGLTDAPKHDGGGTYRGTFDVGIAAICSAGDESTSKLFASLYFDACRAILLDKPSLGGVAENVTSRSAENDWLSGERNRSLAATFGNFDVSVPDLTVVTGGPADHLEDPSVDPGEFDTPETIETELIKEPIP